MQIGIYASVCGGVPRALWHFDFIFVVLTRGNVTLNIAIGPFVRMTLQSRPICGENRPICGNRPSCENRPSCGNRPIWGNRPSCESYIYIYI